MKHVAAVLLLALAKKEISKLLFNNNLFNLKTKQTSMLLYLQSELNLIPLLSNWLLKPAKEKPQKK